MRVLIYLEAHPIRDRYESFSFIGQSFIDMIRDEYKKTSSGIEPFDIRILVSRHYQKLTSVNSDMKPIFLGMTKKENDSLDYYMDSWNAENASIKNWKDLMNGVGEVTDFYERIFERIWTSVFQFDVLLNWSTNGASRKFCESHGINNISMESGATRSPIYDSIYIDAHGVNGNSILQYADLNEVTPVDASILLSQLPICFKEDKGLDSVFDPIQTKYAEEIYSSSGKCILIALQLMDDSNTINFSKYDAMREMLGEIVPLLVSSGYSCFIKPHPCYKDRKINEIDHKLSKDYIESLSSNAYWIDDINHDQSICLLDKMDFTISINSSIGFESMLFGTPSLTLGKAPYSLDEEYISLDSIVEHTFDIDRYNHGSRRMVTLMLKNYLVPKQYAFDYRNFVVMIKKAVHAKTSLDLQGSKAMTKALLETENLNYTIKDSITNSSDLRKRFQTQKVDSTAVRAKPRSNISTTFSSASRTPAQRKWFKFRRDPARFFLDSKRKPLHVLGILLTKGSPLKDQINYRR